MIATTHHFLSIAQNLTPTTPGRPSRLRAMTLAVVALAVGLATAAPVAAGEFDIFNNAGNGLDLSIRHASELTYYDFLTNCHIAGVQNDGSFTCADGNGSGEFVAGADPSGTGYQIRITVSENGGTATYQGALLSEGGSWWLTGTYTATYVYWYYMRRDAWGRGGFWYQYTVEKGPFPFEGRLQ